MTVGGRAVDVQAHGVRSPVALARLAELARRVLVASRVPRALLSVTLVSRRTMARLNRVHLGHRGPTDVIAFTLRPGLAGVVVGDVYICPDVARQHARDHRVGIREELARLVVHGTLHVCGYEHPVDAGRITSKMWRRQEQLLNRFWISPSLPA